MHTNDNGSEMNGVTSAPSDAHGLAALLLVESLIHGLCEKAALSTEEAIAITQRALEVQFDQAEAADGAGAPLWHSHALLSAIAASLKIDEADTPPSPPRLVP